MTPSRPRHTPHPAAYLVAAVMPLVLLAVVLSPIGLLRLYVGHPGDRSAAGGPGPAPAPIAGEAGLGDPYYPQAGNSGYDVAKYTIVLSWDPGTATLGGTTTFSARAAHPLDAFYVDLALPVQAVRVDGAPATFERQGFADLQVRPARPVATGADFLVSVDYSGRPGDLASGDARPWWSTGQEWTVAGEPEASAWWFPANDHPSDPALMDVSVRVPDGMEAVSVGRLESRDSADEADFDTWHWVARQPMATYLNFVSIGQYALQEGTEDGIPHVYAVSEQLTPAQRTAAFAQLQTSGEKVRVLSSLFGPYPFTELGGLVPAHDLWFSGLETQTRPVYDATSILDGRFAPGLLSHELAHMWFGDNVTLRQWDDIFDSEGYASWAQWAYAEQNGGPTADEQLEHAYARTKDSARFWRVTLSDPGRAHLFDTVYVRGPMALQALRNVLGEEAFTALNREWATNPGSRSLEEWMASAQSRTTTDLGPFFRAWFSSPSAPAHTAANGFR